MFIYFWWLRRSFFRPLFLGSCVGPWKPGHSRGHGTANAALAFPRARRGEVACEKVVSECDIGETQILLNPLWVWSRNQYLPLIFHWLFSIEDFSMIVPWFFHHVLWCSMIFLSHLNLIMDISYPPHLAGRTSMAQADIGSKQKPRRRIPVVFIQISLRISSKPWMIWTCIQIHIYFIHIQWFHTNHFQILGKMFNSFWEVPLMWFTYNVYMIESHDYRNFLHP